MRVYFRAHAWTLTNKVTMIKSTKVGSKYDTNISVAGGVEDFASVIRYFQADINGHRDRSFLGGRTSEAAERYEIAWRRLFYSQHSDRQQQLLREAITSDELSLSEKYFVLYLQLVAQSTLFHDITRDVLLKAVFSGRSTITKEDVLSYMRFLKSNSPEDMPWSESTMSRAAIIYLGVLSKLGICSGAPKSTLRELHVPYLSDALFIYFIRWSQAVCEDRTIHNPYLPFAFLDNQMLTIRLKKIEYMPLWDIYQIGQEITIEIKES